MLSVFQKLLKKELGRQQYEKCCLSFEEYKRSKDPKNRVKGSQQVYRDLYEYLKDQDMELLHEKMEHLIDGMCEAVNISKYYICAFMFYLLGALFLIMQRLNPGITIGSLILMSGLFIYKTCQFVANKYCYIDANIVLVYKSVLDYLLKKYGEIDN
ncbi:MAG: hypothetical protein RR056_03600 [Acetivibrio sp.]